MDYTCNPKCGNLSLGVLDAGSGASGWPRSYLLRFVLTLVIDRKLWPERLLTAAPVTGGTWPHGMLCYDKNLQLGTAPNCLTPSTTPPGPTFLVMNVTDTDRAYLQWTKMFDYDPANSLNGQIYAAGGIPQNITAGFNYSAGRYNPCWAGGSSNNEPPCFCHTRECTPTLEQAAVLETWTLETKATFNKNALALTRGVAAVTNHHAPRISTPPIVYVPFMYVGENVTWQMTAVDEDGDTVPTFSAGAGVVTVSSTGMATVGPLASRNAINSQGNGGLPVNTFYYLNYHFRARMTAIDNTIAFQPLTSTVEFMVKSCGQGGARPVNYMLDGSGLFTYTIPSPYTPTAGTLVDTAPIFAQVGPGRCTYGG
eukprot:CAMPEP_0206284796 /NCGR_PEP_ID=MMETSP0047_2-20121206/40968_1 /ASSEMBLY_ACC=CAM_ASM_000192 /TAXON_ID=195065 /ORGANISM="Chroomonas mesostigmatica_cf, Strain CCMP1168" /LENGTH=367 /DNA_ID=CAMNT_0053715279 /DNA_START=301 /DNA_END=1401 /DNA_ORIENTATION=-